MTRLLFIKASPRAASRSVAIAQAHLAALQARDPSLEVDTIELWQEVLPPFDGDRANAKLAIITGQDHSSAERTLWDEISAIAARFAAADIYLFAVPMWNGGVPYRLKQYIDIIHQPGLLFGLDPASGYFGLLTGKSAVLVLTSGAYGPDMPSPAFGVDHHASYLRDWLAQAGVTAISEIRYQPTLLNPDTEAAFKSAVAAARDLAG